jgi:hypothetical protein
MIRRSIFAVVLAGFAVAASSAQADVVSFHYDDTWPNSTVATIQGTPTVTGTCSFRPPPLRLGPRERLIARRQLSVDSANCTTVVEIGRPSIFTIRTRTSEGQAPQSGSGFLTPLKTGQCIGPRSPRCPGIPYGEGYYQVKWFDPFSIPVTDTRAELGWNYTGSCAYFNQAWAYMWWQGITGWELRTPDSNEDADTYEDSRAWHTASGCTLQKSHADSHFENDNFCFPGSYLDDTDVWVKDANVTGWNTGALGGHLTGSTWSSDDCFPLHWSDYLVRSF